MPKKKRRPNPDNIRQKQGVRKKKLAFGGLIEIRYKKVNALFRFVNSRGEVFGAELYREEALRLRCCLNIGGSVELIRGHIRVDVPETYSRKLHLSYDNESFISLDLSYSEIELLSKQLDLVA